MSKTMTMAIAAVLFIVGAVVGNWLGAKNGDIISLKSGIAIYEEPTAAAEHRVLARGVDAVVLERIRYGAPSLVYLNEDINVEADNGETYKLKQGSFFKFIGVNEAEDIATIFADTEDGHRVQLDVPKTKLYPVDEGEWTRIKASAIGDKWVRTKSSWYDNV